MSYLFNVQDFLGSFPELIKRLPNTLAIVVASFAIGIIIGFVIALFRIYKVPVLRKICALYVSFIRGTPLVVQLYLASFGIPKVVYYMQTQKGMLTGLKINLIPAEIYGLMALSINLSAYLSESIRASIESVDIGQFEAAKSIGMTTKQMMLRIVIPQALKVAVPNIGNTIIATVKDTSILFMVGIVDVMGQAKIYGSRTLSLMETYIAVSILYWIVCIVLSKILGELEKKLKISDKAIN